MRCVIQRVSEASVTSVGGMSMDGAALPDDAPAHAAIERGLLALVGFETSDTDDDRRWIAEKIANLRVFEDDQGKLNLSVLDIRGSVLVVPNFTLAGACAKGRRPSFDRAMRPEHAVKHFATILSELRATGLRVESGVFRSMMKVALVNDGPVTLWLDSSERGKGA
jgi:D-tyrosyl-tRNA(Tyr) deacylase